MTQLRITATALALVVAVPLAQPANEPPKHEGRSLGGHTGTVRVLHAPDGTLATFSDDRTIQLWDAQGRAARRLVGHESLVIAASFTPDGKTLATTDGKAVRLWDIAKGKERAAEGLPAGAERLAFAPDGKTLACVVGRGEIRLWDAAAGKVDSLLLGGSPQGRAGHHLVDRVRAGREDAGGGVHRRPPRSQSPATLGSRHGQAPADAHQRGEFRPLDRGLLAGRQVPGCRGHERRGPGVPDEGLGERGRVGGGRPVAVGGFRPGQPDAGAWGCGGTCNCGTRRPGSVCGHSTATRTGC